MKSPMPVLTEAMDTLRYTGAGSKTSQTVTHPVAMGTQGPVTRLDLVRLLVSASQNN